MFSDDEQRMSLSSLIVPSVNDSFAEKMLAYTTY